jgi:DNA-binding response OmpR family regulator
MSRKIRILVVDDDNLLRKLVTEQLSRSDFDATPAAGGRAALEVLRDSDIDVVLLDIMMPDMTGLEALREIRKLEDPPEVVMLTADNSLSTGIEAMRHGAYDYLTKPATLDEMEAVLRKADEKRRLVKQNASLRSVAPAVGRRRRSRSGHSQECAHVCDCQSGRRGSSQRFHDPSYRRIRHRQRCAGPIYTLQEWPCRQSHDHG